jgi:hypothetical protein
MHVDEIVRPCHLILKTAQEVDHRWTSHNVYKVANMFFLNDFIDLESIWTANVGGI